MKVYVGVNVELKNNGEYGDEYVIGKYMADPTDRELEALIEAIESDYYAMSDFDQEKSINEVRMYNIADGTQLYDEDGKLTDEFVTELIDAMGYDTVKEWRLND